MFPEQMTGQPLAETGRECLHSLIEASARRCPDAIALVDGASSLTYAQLDARAEAAARRLRALGVGPGAVVGVAARRRADVIAALLGALKAGAAYCPLDPAYPLERLRFMLDDSGAAALAAGREDAEALADPARPTFLLDGLEVPGLPLPAAAPRAAGASDLAYVIYTSGSTGKPKGVAVEHGAATDFARVAAEHRNLRPGDRVLQFSSLSFDASVVELFPSLCAGATVVLRGESVLPPSDFLRFLDDNRITVMDIPTAYWHELSADLAHRGMPLPASLRLVVTGGEVLHAESLALWRPAAGRIRLLNSYGPTEIIVECTMYEVPADSSDSGPVPIGRACDGAELHILDEEGRPAPDGADGELYVGGRRLARGYLNRPELTAARFVPDPFSGRPGARLYRTGDRVRRRPDGVLEFLGRFDDQVKFRGFRIELGEVEAVLASHPAVGTCAVVLREESSGLRRLVAYASPRGDAPVSASELRAFLSEKLPEYMVPAAVVALPVLPLTPNGKIDRRALPPPAAPPPAGEPRGIGASPLHRQILDVWEEVLGVSPIGLRDDFFALGGHSLLAVRMMAKIEKKMGRRPPVTAMSKGMTIESLALTLDGVKRVEEEPLVRFGPEKGVDPIFFVHPGLGGLYCDEFSRAMPHRPIYLLAPHEIDGRGPVPATEEIARRFVETMRTVSPRGPYVLGAYCSGCTIVYEMARQLEDAGERVSHLLLVAAPTDSLWWSLVRRAVAFVGERLGHDQRSMLYRFNFWGRTGEYLAGMLAREGAEKLWLALRRALSRAKGEGSVGAFQHKPKTEADEIQKAFDWAWASYRPGPYRGRVTFLEAKCEIVRGKKSDLRRLASSSEQAWLPGDHEEILTTYAAEVGAEIGRRLS